MNLREVIRFYPEWGQLRDAYEKVKLLSASPPTRLVCHPDHTSQAELAIKSLGLALRVAPKPDCPKDQLFITGDKD